MADLRPPPPDVPKPRYSLSNVEAKREAYGKAVMDFVGTDIAGEQLALLAEKLLEVAPKGVRLPTIYNSLLTLAGQRLTPSLATQLSWRLAGNASKLLEGTPVGPWTKQDGYEWVPMQVLEVLPAKSPYGDWGAYIHSRVLAGSPCPLRVQKFWSRKFAGAMAYRLGFTRWERKGRRHFPYRREVELTNMRYLALVDPELTRDERPGYFHVDTTPGLLDWNHKLLMARIHADPPCPEDYTHQCHQCPVGYEACPAGCHPRTWVVRDCSECGKEAWCDPGHPRGVCVSCEALGK